MGNVLKRNENVAHKSSRQVNASYPSNQMPASRPGASIVKQPSSLIQQNRSYGNGTFVPDKPNMQGYTHGSSSSMPNTRNQSLYENNMMLLNLTGWSLADIERLRHEFTLYTNNFGVIDHDGFRKLYIASLVNMPWDSIERESESAFRTFDLNQKGSLDFDEYINVCMRMIQKANSHSSSSVYPSYMG
jgi:hypothetical protein